MMFFFYASRLLYCNQKQCQQICLISVKKRNLECDRSSDNEKSHEQKLCRSQKTNVWASIRTKRMSLLNSHYLHHLFLKQWQLLQRIKQNKVISISVNPWKKWDGSGKLIRYAKIQLAQVAWKRSKEITWGRDDRSSSFEKSHIASRLAWAQCCRRLFRLRKCQKFIRTKWPDKKDRKLSPAGARISRTQLKNRTPTFRGALLYFCRRLIGPAKSEIWAGSSCVMKGRKMSPGDASIAPTLWKTHILMQREQSRTNYCKILSAAAGLHFRTIVDLRDGSP